MATVHIPLPMQQYSGGRKTVEVDGNNVRRIIETLDGMCPGMRDALMEGDKLRPGVAVAVDGVVQHLGTLAATGAAKEVVFIPAMSGG